MPQLQIVVSVFELFDDGKTGDDLAEIVAPFSLDDAGDAVTEVGAGIMEAVLRTLRKTSEVTAFDVTIEIQEASA